MSESNSGMWMVRRGDRVLAMEPTTHEALQVASMRDVEVPWAVAPLALKLGEARDLANLGRPMPTTFTHGGVVLEWVEGTV